MRARHSRSQGLVVQGVQTGAVWTSHFSSALNSTFSAFSLRDSNFTFTSQSASGLNHNFLSLTHPSARHLSAGITKPPVLQSHQRNPHAAKVPSRTPFLAQTTPQGLLRLRQHHPGRYPSTVSHQAKPQTRQENNTTELTASQPAKSSSQADATVIHSPPPSSPSKSHKSETSATLIPPHTLPSSSSVIQMPTETTSSAPAQHKPLVVGRTKPQSPTSTADMDSSSTSKANDQAIPTEVKEALNQEISKNVESNTTSAAPAEEATPQQSTQAAGKKKEKAPKQPKAPKAAAAPPAPLSPALIDLRVGHILRAIAHPNADSLYVSTIAMGDAEGTEHTQVDEETGKVVRTVCSGLNGLVPLAEMQDRKIVVVANLKPVNMRSIKSAAMVLAASPKQEEGADPHAPDRVVELVNPPEGSEAGDKVYFEGWEYGEGKGPEKVLNPKKKQWEAIQPGFFTGEDLTVGFDAGNTEVDGDRKGTLVVEGKGKCTVKTLKGAVVR
ncbi:hypothetical protein LTR84_010046 [Exophiala bonariae]|uniref:tRNA-binding domain-containing protein n=1 Tax=Exophiala bonariae TaxID=1690606 RepID=A0AAV9NLP8_9EURO|nr:hypothetical protein LTR84_010046 [Exophiala bonariae]